MLSQVLEVRTQAYLEECFSAYNIIELIFFLVYELNMNFLTLKQRHNSDVEQNEDVDSIIKAITIKMKGKIGRGVVWKRVRRECAICCFKS